MPSGLLAVAVLVAAALAPTRAAAYLNPDTGSMLLQALLGGFAGLAVLVRLFWSRITAFLGRRRKGADDASERR
jgi:Na+/proline symporter